MRLRILAVVVLLAVGIGTMAYVVLAPAAGSSSAADFLTAQATRTDVLEQAVATGTVRAHATYGLGFGRDPAIVAGDATTSGAASSGTWLVGTVDAKVGDQVKAGAVLATADDSDAKLTLQTAQADLLAAQAQLDEDMGPSASDREAAANSLEQAKQGLANAKQSQSDSRRQNALSLSSAKQTLRDAQKQLRKDRRNGALSTIISADKQQVTSAKQQLASTRAQIDASQHEAAQSVESSKLSLASAQDTYDSDTAPATDAVLASDRAAVATAQQSVADAQSALDGARITAPADGVVVAVNVQPGLTAPSDDAVIVAVGPMEVSADFAETDLPSLAVGQPADVTVTALGQALTGTVGSITPVADTSGSGSVVTYAVTITLDSSPDTVRSGMSADVAITTASALDVVAVPAIAVAGRQGAYSVRRVDASGAVEQVAVQVGLMSSTLAEIRSGLAEGDVVVVGTSSARAGTSNQGGLGGFPVGGGGFRPGGGTVTQGGGGR